MGILRINQLIGLFLVHFMVLLGVGCTDSPDPSEPLATAPNSFNPREVPLVQVGHGPEPGQVEVSWRIVLWATFPIVEYQVAASFAGPITPQNWDQAIVLGHHAWLPGQVTYHEFYDATDGLPAGSECWFAVRAVDEEGNLSLLTESPRLVVSSEWWIEGQVLDLVGYPLGNIPVTSGWARRSTFSAEDGLFRIGPFRNVDRIVLETEDPAPDGLDDRWYHPIQVPLQTRPGQDLMTDQDFLLIPRYLKDPRCTNPDNTFLTYLREMTRTSGTNGNHSTILHRWEHYPVSVYIPSGVTNNGVPMDEAAQEALNIWNLAMGEEYFSRTEDPVSANIEFIFEDRDHHYGSVFLMEPRALGVGLGDVIPTRMGVSIDTKLTSHLFVAEISLHELGHTLGLFSHSDCSGVGYLMEIAGGFGSLRRPEPIHLDERRAVQCIRYLPQGQDMTRYR